MQLDIDQRVALDGASQEIAEAQRVRIKYRAQAQPTGGAPLHVLRRLLELLDRRQDALGLAEQRPAAWREGHPARRTLEQADAQSLFQRLELTGERGLRQMEPFGSAR